MYTVYLIADAASRRYVGQTDDLTRRLAQHNAGLSKWTARGHDWKVVYAEEFVTRREALIRERWLKTGAGRDFLRRTLDGRSAHPGS